MMALKLKQVQYTYKCTKCKKRHTYIGKPRRAKCPYCGD